MSSENAAFVLVHGAWHGQQTWDDLVPLLEVRGHSVIAFDLPGAGGNAAVPESFTVRPLDPAQFATEHSPNAGVTQSERTEATIAVVRMAAAQGNGKVVLVGHSLGGLTISAVTEAIPDEISAVVYLTAFLLPPGMLAAEVIGHETMATAKVPACFMADPSVVGAMRLDVASDDPEYLAKVKDAFYGDLADEQFARALAHLHPDEPAQVAGTPSTITAERFGRVARHYIRCANDQAITASGQDLMMRATDAAIGGHTTVHHMDTSHSPFHSDPTGLATILSQIANAPS